MNSVKIIQLDSESINLSLQQQILESAIKLQEFLFFESDNPLCSAAEPVCTIFSTSSNILLKKQLLSEVVLLSDMVFFDSIRSPSWMYASIAATLKIFKSIDKVNYFSKIYNSIPTDTTEQLSWYSKRIGLKTYEFSWKAVEGEVHEKV